MVDWCLAMNVDSKTMDLIHQGYRNSADNECSLNQSLSYIRNNPLILDMEIKKTLQLRDPEVQLAIWAGSALLKKRYHKWDTSMPMPAIAINGHQWDYYIFFEMNDDLVCLSWLQLRRADPHLTVDDGRTIFLWRDEQPEQHLEYSLSTPCDHDVGHDQVQGLV